MRAGPPLIGITGKRVPASTVDGTPIRLLSEAADLYYAPYAQSVADAGGIPVHLIRESDPRRLMACLDGLLVSGGQDIDPRTYGREGDRRFEYLDPERDAFELELIHEALAQEVTLVGICRGFQLLNVGLGGTLHADLEEVSSVRHNCKGIYPSNARVHPVACEPGSQVSRIYGESVQVNSFHHQAIDELGAGLVATGLAPDGLTEAIELETYPGALGVQWHPEVLDGRDPIFDWLVACAGDGSHRNRIERGEKVVRT